jgi:hypothetical protein
MTARAVQARPRPVPVRVAAVASLALKYLFSSGELNATVLGASSHAVWLLAGGDVVVVSTRDATRLPNSVEVAARSGAGLLDSVARGAQVVVGSNAIELGSVGVDLVRWWDPRPALRRASIGDVVSAIRGLPHTVPGIDSRPLRSALVAGSPDQLVDASAGMLGRGPGLTPEGDDVLAGALAAIRTLGAALGSRPALAMLDASETTLVDTANDRTTAFSAALIRRAVRGEVAAPAGTFLRALAGRGDIGSSRLDLLRVGHTSGPALAAGIVLGAHSLVHCHTTPNGGLQ